MVIVDGQDNETCRAEASREHGPLLFGWGLLGMAKTRGDAGVAKMLHWLAHCGLGGSA